jgi:3-oxoacyl-[acyl-carrier protein] reductase
VLVTGAGRPENVGASIARRLAADGWDVATTDVTGDVTVLADLGDASAPAAVFDAVGDRGALVICHTYFESGGFGETTAESLDRHLAVNVRATVLLIAEFARRRSGPGRIVTFTSGPPLPDEIAYAASKGAIEWVTLSAAVELAPLGITANAVDPGPTQTGWMDDGIEEHVRRNTPLGRVGTPEDAAEVVAFLCSPAADWITGEVLRADGGFGLIRTRPRSR